jgi:5,10-methylenetetrahydromethanopterin reductase
MADLKTSVWFQGGLPIAQIKDLSRQAEEAGVDSIWVAEGLVARDAFISLTAIAGVTSRVELGTGVVNPYARHPAQLAASFATLDEASEGRAICGVGVGARDHLVRLGYDVSRPLSAAREMVEVMRRILDREAVDHDGRKFQLEGVRLGFRPYRERIPIFLAATGPKMCTLAGELADGIYLLYGSSGFLTDAIKRSAEKRPPDREFDVAVPVLMAVDDDADVARAQLKPGIGLILTEPNGEGVLEANELDPAVAQRIRDGLASGGIRALAEAVSDEVVDRLTIAGSKSHCLERLEEAIGCGVTNPQALLTGEDPVPALEVLNELKRRRL